MLRDVFEPLYHTSLCFVTSVNNNHTRETPIKVARKNTSPFNKLNL